MADRKKKVRRSPLYPALPLEDAIGRAKALYDAEGFSWANKDVVLGHWGYGPKSSGGIRTLAALLHFGLLEEKGSRSERQVRVSPVGKTLVLEGSPDAERAQALQEAALSPTIYAELWKKWAPSLPSDANVRYYLEREKAFNPDAIAGFIKDFRATVDFANLAESGSLSEANGDGGGDDLTSPVSPHRQQERPMPQAHTPAQSVLDFPIPLVSGGQAVLRMPIPMSEEDYTLLTSMLEANLKRMKKALTRKPAQEEVGDDDT